MALLVAGMMISIAFLADIDTYSWFFGTANSITSVTAAETEDIIDSIEIIKEFRNPENSKWTKPYLKIRKNPDFEKPPVLFFEIEGDAADYVLHINPVRLDTDDYYLIPIETDVNVMQYPDLAEDSEGKVSGTILIKYLNEFIDETIDIEISKEYLKYRLTEVIVREDVRTVEEDPDIESMAMDKMMLRTLKVKNNPEPDDVTVKAIIYLAELVEWKGIDSLFEDDKLSDEALLQAGLDLTKDQEVLIDIIYPCLQEYVEQLKNYISRLRAELEDKETLLENLDLQLISLEAEYEELLVENERLAEQIESLLLEQLPIAPPVNPQPEVPSLPSTGGGSGGGGGSDTGTPDVDTPDTGTGDADEEITDGEEENSGNEDSESGDAGDPADEGEDDIDDNSSGEEAGDEDTAAEDAESDDEPDEPDNNDDVHEEPEEDGGSDAIIGDNEDEEDEDTDEQDTGDTEESSEQDDDGGEEVSTETEDNE